MNVILLVGNIGGDAEVREVSGRKVANFSVATTEFFKNKDGEKENVITWHRCAVWSREALFPYLTKGTMVSVQGKMRTNEYQKEVGEGEHKSKVKIIQQYVLVDSVELLGSKKDTSPNEAPEPFPNDLT